MPMFWRPTFTVEHDPVSLSSTFSCWPSTISVMLQQHNSDSQTISVSIVTTGRTELKYVQHLKIPMHVSVWSCFRCIVLEVRLDATLTIGKQSTLVMSNSCMSIIRLSYFHVMNFALLFYIQFDCIDVQILHLKCPKL